MTDIRPIETVYHGYRFRSRLEARWAVFFEQCHLQYLYEDQGFALPSGPYLPDFSFPQIGGFLEVKPRIAIPVHHFEFQQTGSSPIRDDLPRELQLANELASTAHCMCIVAYGDPYDVFISREGGAVSTTRKGLKVGYLIQYLGNPAFCEAAQAARAARFEHGENGASRAPSYRLPNPPDSIPPRKWLYGRHYARGVVKVTDIFDELFGIKR